MDPYASFIERFLARLIDHAIIFVLVVLFGAFVAIEAGMEFGETALLGIIIFQCLTIFLYFPIYHSSYLQSSPGKRAFNIYVVDRHGFRPGFFIALWRSLCEALIFAAAYWGVYKTIMNNLSSLTEDKIHSFSLVKFFDFIPSNPIDLSHPELMLPIFPEISIRLLILFCPFFVVLLIESMMMFITRHEQALHDLLSGTMVFKRTLELPPDRFFETVPATKKRKKNDELYRPRSYKKATAKLGEKKDNSLDYVPPVKKENPETDEP